eukprot:TRINITY_DN11192_c0_g1_i10.p1 TRINITY_DN11192_c0_g1~~TRINITY_DN11192_c0_g1_i10.p1  ORF type:complete len:623 (+),score=149.93 TRINITY_DN11192_c0_g1_i10:2070-3938(+)
MDMLVKRQENGYVHKRVFLVTNAGGEIKDEGDIKAIIGQMVRKDIKLNVIGIDFEEDELKQGQRERGSTKLYNEKLLQAICKKVSGALVPDHRAIEMMSYFRTRRQPRSVTTFRGIFEISPVIQIPVWSYLKTSQSTFPKGVNLSKLSLDSGIPGGHEVIRQTTLHSNQDPDVEVLKQDVIKGFKYGRTLVPFTKIDVEVLGYHTDPCLQLIGFTDASSVPRHHYMSKVEQIIPFPGDNPAAIACSALIHAMVETDSVGIVRFVKKRKATPLLGVLTPVIKVDAEYFYFNKLPFSEDLRQYPFPPLLGDFVKKEFSPNQVQLDAAEQLIRALDLTNAGINEDGEPTELFKPKNMYNPNIQFFHQALQHKALHPDRLDHPPPMDAQILNHISPPKELFEKASVEIQNFSEVFPLEVKDEKKNEKKRKFWSQALLSDDIKLDSYTGGGNTVKKFKLSHEQLSLESMISGGVDTVGPIHPCEDFKAMFKRRDIDLVDKAIKEICNLILSFVHESIQKSYYNKAIDCVKTLREGCIMEEESEQFNSFMVQMKKNFKDKRRHDFWLLLLHKKINLITLHESDDSDVTEEEALAFIQEDVEEEDKVVPLKKDESDGEHDADSLFQLIE